MSITIITQGGLANQMFQYAFGLTQASRLGTDLKIDNSRNGLHTFRPFNLSLFKPKEEIVSRQTPTYVEKSLSYHPEVDEEIKDGDVLFGYFQCEKYFKSIESSIRQRFAISVDDSWSREAREFLGKILAAGHHSVAVGIRRGDYLKYLHYHGVMPDEYYSAGLIEITEGMTHNPILFVFTDDPDWVEANMQFPYETHIFRGNTSVPGHIGREDIDLTLMSYCNSAIIANSSFHWFGAWLGDRRRVREFNGVVVAPATWFTDPAAQASAGDIVPERWIKI